MARITVEDCLEKIPNRFALIIVAAERTKDLLRDGLDSSPLVDHNNKHAVLSLREIAEGYVTAKYESPQNSASNDIISSEDEVSSSMSFPKVADKDDDNVTIEDLDDEIEELEELDELDDDI